LTEATALEIILEKEDSSWRATGVRFEHGGKAFSVLSAGSVQSPQMLELSGIGNPEILNEAGVNVKVANPNVGENLQEHMSRSLLPSFLSLFRLTDPQ